MSECQRFERGMKRLLSDEIEPEELQRLLAHAEGCSSCETLFELHHDLSDPRFHLSEPEQVELLGVRRAVLREIRRTGAQTLRGKLGAMLGPGWLRPALAAGLAGGLVVIGFLAGRTMVPEGAVGEESVSGFERAAVEEATFQGRPESPYVYSNVRLREAGPHQVALSFDVATHLELVRPKDHPLVSEVVVQAMLQDESLGVRLGAIDHADHRLNRRVRDALVLAMLGDPSMPVRLKALSKLTSAPVDPEVEDAMLKVVAYEESAQMRLLAIDYLTENQVPPEALERAIDSGPPSRRYASVQRARQYLGSDRERSER